MLPDLDDKGYLPPGLHAASLAEVVSRFGTGSEGRDRQANLLREVVEAAKEYPTIKRVLVWGSFVTAKVEPEDLDYSLVVSVMHRWTAVAKEHRRFLTPLDARLRYGADPIYFVTPDFPVDLYVEALDFMCSTQRGFPRGIAEVSLRGEIAEGAS